LLQQQKKKRKEEAYPWKAGTSSGHITSLKQSILETFNIYGLNEAKNIQVQFTTDLLDP
jgi:hypothetical protein